MANIFSVLKVTFLGNLLIWLADLMYATCGAIFTYLLPDNELGRMIIILFKGKEVSNVILSQKPRKRKFNATWKEG